MQHEIFDYGHEQLRPVLTVSDESCPNPGLWPYVFAVLYFVHLKLILLTLLYALFR